jgi:hypothetical protein
MVLREFDIVRLPDLLLLRTVDLWSRVGFHQVDQHDGCSLPLRVQKPWRRLGLGLPPDGPASIIEPLNAW